MRCLSEFARWSGLTCMLLILAACGGGGSNAPSGGAIFSGLMEIDKQGENASAGGAEIEFSIAEDGGSIATLTYSLSDIECANPSRSIVMTSGGRSSTITLVEPVTIKNGAFEFDSFGLTVNGTFTSSTEAEGTFSMTTEEDAGMGNRLSCDFGVWSWIAVTE